MKNKTNQQLVKKIQHWMANPCHFNTVQAKIAEAELRLRGINVAGINYNELKKIV